MPGGRFAVCSSGTRAHSRRNRDVLASTLRRTKSTRSHFCDESKDVPIPRSRNGSVRARHEHQKAIGCRVVVPPHSRKQEKKKRKKIEREVLFDDPPCRSTRAPERLRSQRACFLETWMRRTFLKSRESRVLVFSRIPEKKENAQKKKGRKRDGETKKKDKIIKKAGRNCPPFFVCLFVWRAPLQSENFVSFFF